MHFAKKVCDRTSIRPANSFAKESRPVPSWKGAYWDDDSKRWYIPQDKASATLSRWMGEEEEALDATAVKPMAPFLRDRVRYSGCDRGVRSARLPGMAKNRAVG